MKGQRTWKILLGGIILIAVECSVAFIAVKCRDYTETMYFVSQIFNCIVVALGVVFAAWQYYQYTSDSKRNTDIIRVQKAIDLAKFYKDTILDNYSPMRYILEGSGITDILNKCPNSSMNSFDYMEMRKYISEEDSETIRNIRENNHFFEVLMEAKSIYKMDVELNPHIVKQAEDKSQTVIISHAKAPLIHAFMNNYVTETLNNLEFFAMHFAHNAADSSVIYQSLHQSYIEIVECLYYFIAKQNTDPVDKYYTNVIHLYHKWKKEKLKNEEKRVESERTSQTQGTIIP